MILTVICGGNDPRKIWESMTVIITVQGELMENPIDFRELAYRIANRGADVGPMIDVVGQAQDELTAMRQRAEAAEARVKELEAQIAGLLPAAQPDDDSPLIDLEQDTNDVLDSLDRNLVKGAINWADLRCVSVEKVRGKRGREWYRVEIEEAAPGEEALIAAVAAGLTAKGWYMADIEIATEW